MRIVFEPFGKQYQNIVGHFRLI